MNTSIKNISILDDENSTTKGLEVTEIVLGVYSVIAHLVFFTILVMSKPLQRSRQLLMNHVCLLTFTSSLVELLIVFYTQNGTYFKFCQIMELIWPALKLERMYAIILVAGYRYCAMFRPTTYKNITLGKMLITIMASWIISFLLSLILNITLDTRTRHNQWFCLDGYTLTYLLLNVSLNLVLPTFLMGLVITLLVVEIRKRLVLKVQRRFTVVSIGEDQLKPNRTNKKSQGKWVRQFVVIAAACVLSTVMAVWLQIDAVIDQVDQNYSFLNYYWRYVFLILMTISNSTVPVLCVCYHPKKIEVLAWLNPRLRANITNRVESETSL